ncbi:hypothetical protein, partial [Devosia sp.]|uniref:hypothetical protein n=1 Tax=Devosia sp. TaxID=1871048 RepID=UPI001ACC8CF0
PKRLFGINGSSRSETRSPTGSNTQASVVLLRLTAPGTLSDADESKLQGKRRTAAAHRTWNFIRCG